MPLTARKKLRVLMSLPQADSIYAIGQFNNWSTVATPLIKAGEDQWELRVPPDVKIDQLAFFVIAKGELFGRVIPHANIFYV